MGVFNQDSMLEVISISLRYWRCWAVPQVDLRVPLQALRSNHRCLWQLDFDLVLQGSYSLIFKMRFSARCLLLPCKPGGSPRRGSVAGWLLLSLEIGDRERLRESQRLRRPFWGRASRLRFLTGFYTASSRLCCSHWIKSDFCSRFCCIGLGDGCLVL